MTRQIKETWKEYYDEKISRVIGVDIDTKRPSAKAWALAMLKMFDAHVYSQQPTKKGWHIFAEKTCTYWEACAIRLMAGDDARRLKLDLLPNKTPKNVLFTRKLMRRKPGKVGK